MAVKFTVVIPLYNKEHVIEKTVKSVLNQRFQDYELIIVNDGSTDDSLAVATRIHSPKVTVIDGPNQGVSSARNIGIQNANGEYISFLDADDIWRDDYLLTVDLLTKKYPQSDLFVTAYRVLLGENRIHYSTQVGVGDGCLDSYWKTLRFSYDFVWTSATTVRKSALLDAGLFLPGEKVGQDLDMWARVAQNNPKVAYSSNRCVDYRRLAEHNARSRNRIANASAFMIDLEYELNNPERSLEEQQAIQYKYDLKKTVYIYTCLLNGHNEEAKKAMKSWKGSRTLRKTVLRTGLNIAGMLPAWLLRRVYQLRMKIY